MIESIIMNKYVSTITIRPVYYFKLHNVLYIGVVHMVHMHVHYKYVLLLLVSLVTE